MYVTITSKVQYNIMCVQNAVKLSYKHLQS